MCGCWQSSAVASKTVPTTQHQTAYDVHVNWLASSTFLGVTVSTHVRLRDPGPWAGGVVEARTM